MLELELHFIVFVFLTVFFKLDNFSRRLIRTL